VRRYLRPLPLLGALVCASLAATATPLLHASGPAFAAVGPAPGVPPGNELLEERTVPATTPFNSKGVNLKTRFRNGVNYYFVASGTGVLPVGRQIDAIYCFKADPPTGGCPPAWEMGVIPGLSLLWYFGTTFDSYSGTRGYGWLPGNGYLKYQPTHRYVYKMKAPHKGRVMVGGPGIGDPSENKGAFKLQVYGPPPKTDNVLFDIDIHLVHEPILIHVRQNLNATPLDGTIYVNAHQGKVVADGKHSTFAAWINDSDSPQPLEKDVPHGHVARLHVVEATIDATPTTRELTMEAVVVSATGYSGQKTCAVGDTAKIVIVDGESLKGGSTDSYKIAWTSGICRTHNHTFTQSDADYRKGEHVRVDIACYSPTRGYRKDVC
jgi:hypothetical protein